MPASTPYMTWLDGVAGLFSFIVAGSAAPTATRAARSSSALLLSIGLFGLWLGGLLSAAVTWQVWWTFGGACAYFVLAISAGFMRPSGGVSAEEHERPRRVA